MPAVAPNVSPDVADELLTPEEAAGMLRIPSHRTMERWRAEGTGPAFVKVGRRVAYRRQDLHTWLDQRVRHST